MTKRMTPRARIEQDFPPLALKVGEAGEALRDWRKDAGAKSKWTGHQKMAEAGHFRRFNAACDDLAAAFKAHLPAHWGMADWGIRPSRMGKTLYFSGRGGSGKSGRQITAEPRNVLFEAGIIAGLILSSRRPTTRVRDRLDFLGINQKEEDNTFAFHTLNNLVEAQGRHPADAYARAAMKADLHIPVYPPANSLSLERLFEAGITQGFRAIEQLPEWNAAPTLWKRLRKDRVVTRLAGRAPDYRGSDLPWRKHPPEDYDAMLAMALALRADVATPNGKPHPYLLKRGGWNEATQGWCGSSAILAHVIKEIDAGKKIVGFEGWEVYALADERGHAARKSLQIWRDQATQASKTAKDILEKMTEKSPRGTRHTR